MHSAPTDRKAYGSAAAFLLRRMLPPRNLKKLHRMVTAVKRDGEVGLAYMKSFEREERIRKQGEEEGRKEGKREGLEEGEIVGKTKEVIKLGRRFGKSEKEIILLLQEELQIDKDKAEDFLKKYDK